MNRRFRRGEEKRRFKLLSGGKPAEVPDAHPEDSPADRFGKAVQALWVLTRQEGELEDIAMARVMLQMTAKLFRALGGGDPRAFGSAAEREMAEELERPDG